MESFIKKLKGLHFFLIEKEGELILKKSKNNSKSDPYDFKKDKEDIKGFLRKHKEELIDFLQNKKKAKKASNVLYKLSPLQEGMLFQGLYDKESNAYTVQLAIDFISGVDAQVMKSSWEYVFKNHSILRTAFFHKEFSIPVQRVYEDVVLPFRELDYSTYSPSEQAIKLNTFLISDRAAGFTFDEVPLLRITLIKTGEKSYKMVFTNHHILMDGWSLSIVLGEFLQAYEAFYKGEIPPQKITDTYEDYVKYIASKNVEKEEDFWKTYMEGLSAPSLVPFSKTMSSGLGITENYKDELLSFDSDFTSQLVAYARRNHITVNTVVQGAWALLLANYTGNKNVVYGVTVSGRPKTLERAEERVGLYINTLPLHATIEEGKLLSEWLSELQLGHTEAREHQYTNLAKIQHLSGIKGTLFDSLVVFENYPVTEALKKEQRLLKYKNVEANEQTSYLLTLTIGLGTVLDIKFTHNENVLASSDVLLIQGHFRKVLEQFIELSENSKITDVDIVSKKEKERLLEFNTTSVSYPKDKTLLDLIQNQVLQTPYADAVIFEENRLTYKELDERSNQLAHYLIEQGVVTESLVGICLDRSLSMMIGILGILKSGAAYVPIDPDYPEERIHYILQDTASKIVLCDHRSEEILQSIKEEINCLNISDSLLIKEYPTHPTYVKLCPDNLAYVIYTSGSTGKPKGVMNEHRGIVNRLLWTQEHYQLEAEKDIVLQKTTFCFDVSVWELFWPLIAGVPMVFLRPEGHKDIKCLKEAIDSYKVTTLHFVPSMLWIFLLEISRGDCQSLKRVLCSGEALRLDQVNLFREKFPDVRLDNLYGPTEAAIDVTSWQMPKNKQLFKIPIGKPVANTTLYILDKKHRIVPIGVPGDLYIGGVQVARGYLNKELLTKERFIENPFIEGERMYDTGDVARWLVDGNIEYIGRSDQQVKIRGYRIELGEIETILSEQPKILGSCVLAKKDAGGSQQLIGYVVTQGELDKQELQKALKKKLPEYMVPQLWVTLTEIPLTSNGKIDRKSLPDPELSDLSRGVYVAARDEMEEELVGIWQGILNIDKIGVQDDFFDLGGHSLLATRLVSAIRKKMEIALEIKDIFIYPTIESLKIHMFNQGKGTILPALVPQQITTHIPLSFSQERLWFIDQLEGSIPYHIPMILRLTGDLDVHKLIQSLYQIVSRHQALRTVIKSEEGVGYQKIISAENWSMEHEVLDVSKDDISNKLKKFISKPFDLSSDYLFRVCLYELGDNNYILIGVFHHIASDGWSNGILIKEFLELYTSLKENRTTTLLPLPIQYKDYSIWQRTHIEGDVLDKELSYWESKLKKVSPLVLPTDYTRPSIQNTNGADIAISLDVKTRESLKNICKEEGVTMFMGLLSIFKVLLYRYSGQHDICVGTPIANRTQSASEGVIGFFANTLALRSDINHEMSFREVLEQVKRTTLEAYDHQQAPFEKVVDRIIMTRDMSMTPLFQVMFTLQNDTDNEAITLPGLDVSPYPYETSTSSFDLTLTVTETIAGLGLNFTYATALFSKETIQQLAQHYKTLVIEFIGNRNHSVDTVPMLEVSEIERLLKEFNTTKKDYPLDKTVAELFEEQVQKTPDEVAIVFDQDTITYSELDKRANKLANYLNKKEIKKEELVGICMNRSLEMVIGILGVLKSGKAYVPIAPDYPEDRIFYILEDASISLVLSKENEAISFSKKQNVRVILMDKDWNAIAKETIEKPSVQITANHLAYVIYTSGSTGRPKGVMIEHKSVVNFLCAMIEKLHLGRLKSLLSVTTYTFDIFYLELFAPIIQGAKTILLNEESTLDAYKLKEAIAKYSPEFMQATPSTWQMLISSEWNNDENVTVLCGGEAIKEDLKNKLTAVSDTVWNLYGPTEATIWVTAQQLNASEKISIGKPIDNVRASILDRNDALVPIGVVGELCFSGVAIARGYVNKPGLTSERFILDPFISGGRMYRTGDLARWLPDGSLEFLGRKDDQVKIRGYRIELGEIENVLSELEGLDSCCVLSREDGSGVNRLIGYVVSSTDFDKQEAQAFLKHRLPEYMIPQLWVVLEAMPLTSNGKISKKDLPDPDNSGLSVAEYVGYRNKTEEELTSIWQELLGVTKIGVYDNFFDLGGHSLLATRLVSMIRKELEVSVSIRDIFNHTSIASLGLHIDTQSQGDILPSIVSEPKEGKIPLSFSQERLWFIDQLEGSVQYHMPVVLQLEGSLSIVDLESSFREIVLRHEILRTVIDTEEGKGYQRVISSDNWQLTKVAITEELLEDHLSDFISTPFDLSSDYMLRMCLYDLGEDTYVLGGVFHHISSDGWSNGILVREFASLYHSFKSGRGSELDPLPIQYSDYAIWQRRYIEGSVLENQLSYWDDRLRGVSPLLLPTDYLRPSIQSTQGSSISFCLEDSLSQDLIGVSKEEGVTLFMLLLGVFKVLLYKYSGQSDICVGTPIANRTQSASEDLIGFFVNTLALRSELDPESSFRSFLSILKQTTLSAYDHQDTPFEKVVDRVITTRDMSRSPLFQVMFELQNNPQQEELSLESLQLSPYPFEGRTSQFDLTFTAIETVSGISLEVEYCTVLFKESSILRMLNHYQELLRSVVKDRNSLLSDLSILTTAESKLLLEDFNNTAVSYPLEKTFVSLFESQVSKTPESTAIVLGDSSMSYQELDDRSNQVAHYLRSHGVVRDSMVGICLERSLSMFVGILGILKSGGAYVPIKPDYPVSRIGHILEEIGSTIVLTDIESESVVSGLGHEVLVLDIPDSLFLEYPTSSILDVSDPDSLAYVIYTSGSTGVPKGAMIEHAGMLNHLLLMVEELDMDSRSVVAFTAPFTFDISVWQILSSLLCGGRISIYSESQLLDPVGLQSSLYKEGVTILQLVPSYVSGLLDIDSDFDLGGLDYFLVTGEAVHTSLLSKWFSRYPDIPVVNAYGPTEAGDDVSLHFMNEAPSGQNVSIGKPVANMQIYVVDDKDNLCPVGVMGELWVSGIGVGRGYLNDSAKTAKVFRDNPFTNSSSRLYKTGDLGRWLSDGSLEFLGRKDDQVKIRGHRIELGEIESVLSSQSGVNSCCVLAKSDSSGLDRLVGYVVMSGAFDKQFLQDQLNQELPSYMVPLVWVCLEEMPLTVHGKINKKELPDPDMSSLSTASYVAASNEIEEELVRIWQDLLGVEQVGVHDNFFELGGDSIITIQVVSNLKRVGYHIRPRNLFENQTIFELAKKVKDVGNQIEGEQGRLEGVCELLPIQQWYFNEAHEEGSQYNQSVLLSISKSVEEIDLSKGFIALVEYHDALRFNYQKKEGIWVQEYSDTNGVLVVIDCTQEKMCDMPDVINKLCNSSQKDIDITKGQVFKGILIKTPEEDKENRLFIAAHHLVIDGISWRILLTDLERILDTIQKNQEINLGSKGSSYRQWYTELEKYTNRSSVLMQQSYWAAMAKEYNPLPVDHEIKGYDSYKNISDYSLVLDKENTFSLISEIHQRYGTEIDDILLACLALTIGKWSGHNSIVIGQEGHGREDISKSIDIGNTIGWFTNLYPIALQSSNTNSLGDLVKSTKEQLRCIPDKGLGYGALRYLHASEEVRKDLAQVQWDVVFNYLGQLDNAVSLSDRFKGATESTGKEIGSDIRFDCKIEINGSITQGQLRLNWSYSKRQYNIETIEKLAEEYLSNLKSLISHCKDNKTKEYTPSDYGLEKEVQYQELEAVTQNLIEEAYEGEDILEF